MIEELVKELKKRNYEKKQNRDELINALNRAIVNNSKR